MASFEMPGMRLALLGPNLPPGEGRCDHHDPVELSASPEHPKRWVNYSGLVAWFFVAET